MNPVELVVVGSIAAAAIAGGIYLAARLAKDLPRKLNFCVVDGPNGPEVNRYKWEHDRFVTTYGKERKSFHPTRTETVQPLSWGPWTLQLRYFSVGPAGNIHHPTNSLFKLPRDVADAAHQTMIRHTEGDNETPVEVGVDEAGVKRYAQWGDMPETTVRSYAKELANALLGGRADVYVEANWRRLLLTQGDTIGAAVVAVGFLGYYWGIQTMSNPAWAETMTSPTAQWVMLGIITIGAGVAVWRGSK